MSKANELIKKLFNKGYRVVNGELFNHKGKKLNPGIVKLKKISYLQLHTVCGGLKATFRIHRFVGYQKYGDTIFQEGVVVRHKDGDSLNNTDGNILIGSYHDNSMDRNKLDRIAHAKHASSYNRKFTDEQVRNIREDRRIGLTYKELGIKYSVCRGTLRYVINKAIY